jgi:diguanylate cyclase (GGDEF)-like protein
MSRQHPAPARTQEASQHSWLSNPLDWSQIDRMILLAVLILVSPVLISGGLILLYYLEPQQLVLPVTLSLLGMYVVYGLILLWFILAALRKRQHQDRWELMENFAIYSYLFTILVGSWVSGTEFTTGVILLMLGVNIASPLTSIHRIKLAYALSYLGFAACLIMEFSGHFRHAPLLAQSPYHADGSPKTFWLVFQCSVVFVSLIIVYIALLATERWGSRENLYREMSTVDGLTRLTNRRSFIERGKSEFLRALRSPSAQLSCIMMDIDHFKRINDTYGHQAGDAVLVNVSQILMNNARQYDEAGRYGGEEFALFLPHTPLINAARVAERLRASIEASRVEVEGQSIQVTASFGVACYPCDGISDVDSLLKAADTALYEAKHAGRNRVVTAQKQEQEKQALEKPASSQASSQQT